MPGLGGFVQAGFFVLVFFFHVSALLDQVRHHLDHALLSRIKERMLGPVLSQRCLDLVVLGPVEGSFAGPAARRHVGAVL